MHKLDPITVALCHTRGPETKVRQLAGDNALPCVRCYSGHEAYFRPELPVAHFELQIVLEICAPLASYDAGDRTLFPAHDIKAENFAQHGSKQIAVGSLSTSA
jgi:hypothetical protein